MEQPHQQDGGKRRASRLCLDPAKLRGASLLTVDQFCQVNVAFTPASVRWSIFKRGGELERAGGIVRAGRRILIKPERYIECLTGTSTKA